MDFGHPYLRRQLIAYLGGKRSLLPFLHESFARLEAPDARRVVFADPFAGSGAVSRLARLMGWEVVANDWEPYSFVINSCHLAVEAAELEGLFGDRGGIDAALSHLNGLRWPAEADRYLCRHYAPRSTAEADWRTERLFYTAENARAIDAIRSRIEEWYPGEPVEPPRAAAKRVLVALLLYEAATHTNTSGVFKACHRGFGGLGGDALRRIMAAIALEPPVLVDAPRRGAVCCQDAERFLSGRTVDVCYLDPPYNQHQYGSNYFMLNTIARWDRPPVSGERGPDGRLLAKAGIRPDWRQTRSAFCSRATAAEAMRRTVSAADCRWLCLSYGGSGLLGVEELCDLLAETGRLTVRARDHAAYPGGKGSLRRADRALELLLVVDRSRRSGARERRAVAALRDRQRLAGLLASTFDPELLRARFPVDGEAVVLGGERLAMWHFLRFVEPANELADRLAREPARERLVAGLEACRIADRPQEVQALAKAARAQTDAAERRALVREAVRLARSFAHRKHRAAFRESFELLRSLDTNRPAIGRLQLLGVRRGVQ